MILPRDPPLPPDPVNRGWYSDAWNGWAFIHPANDIQGHSPYASDCACEPRVDYVLMTIVHHAFDGRDLVEALQRGEKII